MSLTKTSRLYTDIVRLANHLDEIGEFHAADALGLCLPSVIRSAQQNSPSHAGSQPTVSPKPIAPINPKGGAPTARPVVSPTPPAPQSPIKQRVKKFWKRINSPRVIQPDVPIPAQVAGVVG